MNIKKSNIKVLLTGATGFIGSYIKDLLIQNNFNVAFLQRKIYGDNKENVILGDISEPGIVDIIKLKIKSIDAVIHSAACIQGCSEELIYVNSLGTANIAKLAVELGAKTFVYISSIPIIGEPDHIPFDETHPERPKDIYHATKLEGEKLVQIICKDINTIILRIPSPIGIGMHENTFPYMILEKLVNNEDIEIFGKGKRVQNYMDVRDIAEAVVKSLYSKQKGIYLLGGKSISNEDYVKDAVFLVKSNSKIFKGIHEDSEEYLRWIYSTQKAYNELNIFPQKSLNESILWMAEWIRSK